MQRQHPRCRRPRLQACVRASCLIVSFIVAGALGGALSEGLGYWLRLGRRHSYVALRQPEQHLSPAQHESNQPPASTAAPAVNWTAQPFQNQIDQATWEHATAWAARPDSFCFQGPHAQSVNLTIVSAASPDLDAAAISCIRLNRILVALEQNARYCHFYNLDPSRAPHWSKVLAVKQAMQISPFVLWVDLDSLFPSFDHPLHATFLSFLGDKEVVVSAAKPGQFDMPQNARDDYVERHQDDVPLNTGVIFLRSSPWAARFLDAVYTEAPYSTYWGFWGFFDQSGFVEYMHHHREEWLQHVKVVPFRLINGRGSTSLLYHVAGGAHKVGKYKYLLKKCELANCHISKLSKCGSTSEAPV